MDLVFARADDLTTIVEIKYTKSPVGKSVNQEFERKLALFELPKRKRISCVPISAVGADKSPENSKIQQMAAILVIAAISCFNKR